MSHQQQNPDIDSDRLMKQREIQAVAFQRGSFYFLMLEVAQRQ